MSVSSWEHAFSALDKRAFSVEACGGYDLSKYIERYCSRTSFILDYGCGKGHMVAALREQGYVNVYGTDPSEHLVSESPEAGKSVRVMNGPQVPFEGLTFDFVYCSGVLHHIDWSVLRTVMTEIQRVLSPGGKFVYVEPRASIARSLGHVVVLSPLSRVSRNASLMAECLRAEWPTYRPWLDRQAGEFLPLCQEAGFRSVEHEKRLFTVAGVLQKNAAK